MPSLTRLVGVIAARRLAKEDAGYQRLLKAVFAPPAIERELEIPTIHPYSIIWNLVESDPAKWQ